MKKIFNISLLITLALSSLYAEDDVNRQRKHSVKEVIQSLGKGESKEVSIINDFNSMFTNGKVTGQIEIIYSNHQIDSNINPYSTAIGGQLMFELAQYNGFNGAAEFTTSHDIGFISGDRPNKNASMISSSDGRYTELSQVYINYTYEGLNLRIGRQLIDTPLADSDDIRIINNTFEACIASYELDGFSFIGGRLSRWQGTDAGLDVDNPWQSTGDDGTYFGGLSYSNDLLDASIWYYDISADNDPLSLMGNVANKSTYIDISLHTFLNDSLFLHSNAQYLNQSESDGSGVESSIYGLMFELVFDKNFALSAAYNKASKESGKNSFSGFGGGALYTNMDNMIIDNITADRDASVVIAGLTYSIDDFNLMYAYGDFDGNADSLGQKEHIIEQNIGIEYTSSEDLTISLICTINDDKEDTGAGAIYTGGNFENYRLSIAYTF